MSAPIPDHASLPVAEIRRLLAQPVALTVVVKRTCNRHDDCDAADERARTKGPKDYYGRPQFSRADHCHDDCCEDCFGS